MNIFGNTAAGFSKEVDNAMSAFKSTITKLKANNLAAKLEALFE